MGTKIRTLPLLRAFLRNGAEVVVDTDTAAVTAWNAQGMSRPVRRRTWRDFTRMAARRVQTQDAECDTGLRVYAVAPEQGGAP